jgi:hypothetical protein
MLEQSFDERGQMLEHTLHWEKLNRDSTKEAPWRFQWKDSHNGVVFLL